MASLCDKIELFVDGDLPPGEAEEFRLHIADCERCQQEMADLVQLQILGGSYFQQAATPSPAPVRPSSTRVRWSRPRLLAMGALAASLVVMVAAALLLRAARLTQNEVWLAGRKTRLLEARVSHPEGDRHRPLEERLMSSGAPSAFQALPLEALGALEKNDPRGLVAAYLIRGDPGLSTQALGKLAQLGHSPDLDSDRAAALLLQRGPEHSLQALRLTQAILSETPRHPQAMWNRALALRELGLELAAARGFREVASLKEEGWSAEAAEQAKALEDLVAARHARWKAAVTVGQALVGASPTDVPKDFVGSPVARKLFYDAVRAAPGRARLLALLPIAESLDAQAGGRVLGDYVRRVAEADFERRGPLAERYAALLQGRLAAAEKERLLSDLLASKEEDILLGALVQLGATSRYLELYEAKAKATRDPWFQLFAAEERAEAEVAAGRWTRALQTLLDARGLCQGRHGLVYRCLVLDRDLSSLSLKLHQLDRAREDAERGWREARRLNEWGLEPALLWNLAQIARLGKDMPLARAYLEELLEHERDTPDMVRRVHQELAVMAMQELRVDEARREIDLALATGTPLGLPGAFTLVDVARLTGKEGDEAHLIRAIEAARPSLSPGEQAVATHVLGRYFIERKVEQGRSLLWRSIEEAEQPGLEEDRGARRARAYSFTSLLLEAGRREAFEEVLELFAQERRGKLPGTCLLAATADSERTLLVARGVTGEVSGVYDASRRGPLPERLDVAPEALLAVLRPCQRVEVLARPPLHGRGGLLPPEMAWSYLTRASTPRAPRPGPPVHLVISGVKTPPELRLEHLAIWNPTLGPEEQRVILSGLEATPSRVLEAMEDATEVDLGVHGIINDFSNTSYLVLASEQDGPELSVPEVRAATLRGAPFVVLAACHAAHTAYSLDAPFSLPAAFIEAGARGVLAATVKIPDQKAASFFDAVRLRMRSRTSPAEALRDVRVQWLKKEEDVSWIESVLLFE